MKWQLFNRKKIEDGVEYFFYNKDWIDEDYPDSKGIRIGIVCDGLCITSVWDNYQDYYKTDEEKFPTHYMEIPVFEEPTDESQIELFT